MAAGCGLSHQCPGEAELGTRVSQAGVRWGACGENIGEGGPVAVGNASIGAMAVGFAACRRKSTTAGSCSATMVLVASLTRDQAANALQLFEAQANAARNLDQGAVGRPAAGDVDTLAEDLQRVGGACGV
ncbi:hypothetical protein ABH935_000677 [Catenulispora sp. GAS73]